MARTRTAAYEERLIFEIFREPVQFKGAAEAGSFHSSCDEVACCVSSLMHSDLLPCQSRAVLPFSFFSGPPCREAPSFDLFFLSFQG